MNPKMSFTTENHRLDTLKDQKAREIFDLVRPELALVEEELRRQSVSAVRAITEIGQYLQASGGKRLRPALVLLASRLCGYEGPAAVRLGAVVELIHTATLVHDDIIDDADLRRGRPSTNSRWGNHTSVLAGDWLYMQAFNIALAERNFRILDILIGVTQVMVEGELIQMGQLKRIDLTEDDYLELAYRKTACLFSACLRMGALLGRMGEESEIRLGSYGANLGLAFQVIDDILDFTSSEELLGKPIGSDLREGKVTLPLIYLLPKCRPQEAERIARVLREGGFQSVPFPEISEMIERYHVLDAARAKARHFAELAQGSLAGFPDSSFKNALQSLAQFTVERQF
ncbi:MAG: polyprenyl synthetase family protein [Terriglobia bacterium]